MKTCTLCHQAKPLEDFGRLHCGRDGLNPRCKPCARAKAKEWVAANPERERENRAASRARNREQRIAYNREYRRGRDPASFRADRCRRQAATNARKYGVQVLPFSAEQLAARLSMFPGCWVCRGPWTQTDHVKPLARGGPHILANLRPICGTCNQRKWSKWPVSLHALEGSG